jgi:hypothetical protein
LGGVSWVIQKGGEAVDCAGVDGDIVEAEGGSEGSLQEEEVPASRSASQEDQGHSEKAYQVVCCRLHPKIKPYF